MKKDIRTLAALLIASATFVACSSDNDIIGENQQPVNPTGKYTMTINASKGDGATTRALSLDGKTLNATWTDGEEVTVYEGDNNLGTLSATNSNGATCTLTGELTTAPTGSEVTLKFNTPTYTGQDGTLDYIASNCDYATATTTVTVSGNTITGTDVEFTNQQAIIKFTLLDKGNSDAAISPSALSVTDGTSTVELTSIPAATYTANGADNVLYVAFPAAGSAKTVTLTATVGTDTYTFEKSGVTFTNGQYYEITVKMTKQAPAPSYRMAAEAETDDKGNLICTAGHIHAYNADAECTATRVAMITYVGSDNGEAAPYNHGLALALSDEGQMAWADAIDACSAKNTNTPVTGATWLLASKDQWNKMIDACKNVLGTKNDYQDLRDGFTSVGGSNLVSHYYWASTEYTTTKAYVFDFNNGIWNAALKTNDAGPRVRACLAF